MRKPHGTDFTVDVDYTLGDGESAHVVSLGRFTFARRTVGDVFKIRGEYTRLTGGNWDENGVAQDTGAWAVSTISTLLVASPPTFNLDTVDPLTDDTWESKVAAVFWALRDKELSFRKDSTQSEQKSGP
jgi:hypothetical protein